MSLKDCVNQLLEDFEKEAKKILEKMCPLPNEPLYHYTSFSNFRRIIQNRELCFTDYRHLNDPVELLLSQQVLKEAIEEKLNTNDAPTNLFLKELSEVLYSILDKGYFNNIRDRFDDIEMIQSDIYTFSFCSKRDYLPLWRWYGDDGAGISIGFRPEYFKPIENNELTRNPIPAYLKINYDKEKFFVQIEELLNCTENKITELMIFCRSNSISLEYFTQIKNNLSAYLNSSLISLMPGFKHHGYKDEHEYRLYYIENKTTFKPESNRAPEFWPFDEIPTGRKKTRERNITKEAACLPLLDPNVPFVKSDPFSLDDIAEIWVGPCLHFECAKEQIIKLLTQAGYNANKINKDGINIRKSEAPYR